ncbi:MAG: phosphoenolpyruvate synthase [Candidatus Pacearchaeota archaeon]
MVAIKREANAYVRWLYELNKSSGQIAGGKGANLAEMFNSGFPVPPAFIVTTSAYWRMVESAGIKNKIEEILSGVNVDNTKELTEKSKEIRSLILKAEMPDDLSKEILESYNDLSLDKRALTGAKADALFILKHSHEPVFVAVRSSATTEDLADASFAGQQESYLNIKGNSELIETVKKVFASLFTARAIYYRKKKGFSHEKFALAVVVQKMIDSQKSGVMFSKNPVKRNDNVLIEAVFGLGEGIVSGRIKPDSYEVSRELKLIEKKLTDKKIALTRNSQGDTETIKLTKEISTRQVLNDYEITQLADYAIKIEEHYGGKPQDIEFAIEDDIYIVQSRPVTTEAKSASAEIKGEMLLSGLGASPGVASGKVKIVMDLKDLDKVQKGDILVTQMTNPDMVITMQKSAAIITDEGGITSHAAIVSREMGIPAVVGTERATNELKEGQIVTVDGSNGKVYSGKTETVKSEVKPIVPTKTKIKVILDLPEAAERASKTKCSAIGLLRLEGIIASSGKHPALFLKENKLAEYTNVLEKGIEKISEHFKEIWIRASDLRTDEYSTLEGAPEQNEGNPMLGMHGIRFSLKNPKLFKAELNAVKKVSEKFHDKTFGIMIPQVISVDEVLKTKEIIDELGMNKIHLGIMVETPSACLVIKDLLKTGVVKFISFGTNDLTQYTLAIDRNNEDVQYLYNEMHPAILNEIKRVIRTCQEMKVESSICGQSGSNKDMVKYLIETGIDSISVNADAAYDISVLVSELEKNNKSYNEGNKTNEKQFNKLTNRPENKWQNKNRFKDNNKNNYKQKNDIPPQQKAENIVTKIENVLKQEIIKQTEEKFDENKEKEARKQPEEHKIIQQERKYTPPSYVAENYGEPIEESYGQYENNFLQEQIEPDSNKKPLKKSEEEAIKSIFEGLD